MICPDGLSVYSTCVLVVAEAKHSVVLACLLTLDHCVLLCEAASDVASGVGVMVL
jgi:hypothetical protein